MAAGTQGDSDGLALALREPLPVTEGEAREAEGDALREREELSEPVAEAEAAREPVRLLVADCEVLALGKGDGVAVVLSVLETESEAVREAVANSEGDGVAVAL